MDLKESPLSRRINSHLAFSRFPNRSKSPFATGPEYRSITEFDLRGYFSMHHGIEFLSSPQYKPLVEYILRHTRELFAVSIVMDMPKELIIPLMTYFMKNGIKDYMIPNIGQKIKGIFPQSYWRAECDFLHHRYVFRAPVLFHHRRYEKRDFEDDRPIPIIHHVERPMEGNFGNVYKVTIHDQFLDQPIQQVGPDTYFLFFITCFLFVSDYVSCIPFIVAEIHQFS